MSLSDKTKFVNTKIYAGEILFTEDVKEFIRVLKETEIELRDLGLTYEQGVKVWKRMNDFIDKEAGKRLIGKVRK